MPLPSITTYNPTVRAAFEALLAGAPLASIATVLDVVDEMIYNERDVMVTGLTNAPLTAPDEPVTVLTTVADSLLHHGPLGFAYIIDRFSVGTGGLDLLDPRHITPPDPNATALEHEVFRTYLLAERQILITGMTAGTPPLASDLAWAGAAPQGVFFFDVRACTYSDPTHATIAVDVTPQGGSVVHLSEDFDPTNPGQMVPLTFSAGVVQLVTVAAILTWTPLITTWYLRVQDVPIVERPGPTTIAIPCRIPQQALRFGLGELATWATVTENGTPFYPVGATFMVTLTHFPLLCSITASVHLHRIALDL